MSTDTDKRGGLPEDTALGAFAAGAIPPRRKRNRNQEAAPAESEPAQSAADVTAEPAPVTVAADLDAAPAPTPDRVPEGVAEERQVIPEQHTDPATEEPTPAPPRAAVARRPQVRAVTPSPARPLAELGIQRDQQPAAGRITQCTVNVSVNVRDRFAAYQLAKKLEKGSEPTNAVVVRRAILHARRNDLFAQMLESIRHRQAPLDDEDDDPDGLFGDVQGRRVERGRGRDMAQQSFRPSYEELGIIDALVSGYGFDNRSEFLDAALDAFLPPLPDKRRRS